MKTLKATMPLDKVISTFSSSFDETVPLVEVLSTAGGYVVRVLGEPDRPFTTEEAAMAYAQNKAGDF